MKDDFKADLGMILRRKNFAKLISGGYLNGAAPVDSRWSMSSAGSSEGKAEDSKRRIIEENEAFASAQGWVTPNREVTRE